MEKIHVDLKDNAYEVIVGCNLINEAEKFLNLKRKVLIVTDDNIPSSYSEIISAQCEKSKIVCVKNGETSKSFNCLQKIVSCLCETEMSRSDCVVAVGGGVVGDLAGFAASCYMRGIDFYNIPTTLLSQIDSSIGGKTAINFNGIKNVVGSFYQPKAVITDINVLKSLPKRQMANGLAEAIKMSLTSDKELFEFFEKSSYEEIVDNIQKVIVSCLKIKKNVVEQDEKESGLRKVLNFGHTVGHAIESCNDINGLYHGECVALGMLCMCSKEVKERLVKVLKKVGLPYEYKADANKLIEALRHDKKAENGFVNTVIVNNVGEFEFVKTDIAKLREKIEIYYKGE